MLKQRRFNVGHVEVTLFRTLKWRLFQRCVPAGGSYKVRTGTLLYLVNVFYIIIWYTDGENPNLYICAVRSDLRYRNIPRTYFPWRRPTIRKGIQMAVCWKWPSGHMSFVQHHRCNILDVNAMLYKNHVPEWPCIDVNATLYWRHVRV